MNVARAPQLGRLWSEPGAVATVILGLLLLGFALSVQFPVVAFGFLALLVTAIDVHDRLGGGTLSSTVLAVASVFVVPSLLLGEWVFAVWTIALVVGGVSIGRRSNAARRTANQAPMPAS